MGYFGGLDMGEVLVHIETKPTVHFLF